MKVETIARKEASRSAQLAGTLVGTEEPVEEGKVISG